MLNTENIHQEIIAILKRRILTGEYISGAKLPPERILSKNLGASRGILREALKALVATGYLTIVRGRIGGYMITKAAGKTAFDAAVSATNMNRENVLVDGLEFRRMFEPKICRAAAKNRTDINIVNLERFAEECERIENNSVLSYRSNRNFHFEIARSTQNNVIINFLPKLSEMYKEMSNIVYTIPTHLSSVFFFHREILNAIKEKDAHRAEILMDTHLAFTLNDVNTFSELNLQDQQSPKAQKSIKYKGKSIK